MFEDALMESCGRLRSRAKFWMVGTLALNVGVVAAMVLVPLLHPEALPKTMLAMVIAPPPPPVAAVTAVARRVASATPVVRATLWSAPRRIPTTIAERDEGAPPDVGGPVGMGDGSAGLWSGILSLPGPSPSVVAVRVPLKRVNVSAGVIAGHLLVQTWPVYPAIAKAAHVNGSVVLRAVISREGTIENLMVQSGPPMLRQAALDGVRGWRYRPYLLNGEPTEVDTTITVNFTNE